MCGYLGAWELKPIEMKSIDFNVLECQHRRDIAEVPWLKVGLGHDTGGRHVSAPPGRIYSDFHSNIEGSQLNAGIHIVALFAQKTTLKGDVFRVRGVVVLSRGSGGTIHRLWWYYLGPGWCYLGFQLRR